MGSKNKYLIRKRMVAYTLISIFIVLLGIGAVTYIKVSDLIFDQCRTNGIAIASAAADKIDGDLFDSIDSSDCDAYHQVYDVLDQYNNFSTVQYVYAMRLIEGELRFVVDTDKNDPAEYMELYETLDDILPAFDGEICADQTLSSDRWGSYISAYAPIYDSIGEVVGVIGIDTDIKSINEYRYDLIKILILVSVVFGIIGVIIYSYIYKDFIGKEGLTDLYTQDHLELLANKRYIKTNTFHHFTIILINIENFRLINSHYGYSIGDEILRYVADNIKPLVKNEGLASRVSSDNFIVLIKNEDVDRFISKVTRLSYTLTNKEGSNEIYIPMYAGIYPIHQGDTVSESISRGLVALGEAKNSKMSTVVVYTDEMYDTSLYEKQIIADFTPALLKNEFVVYFQPKVNAKTNTLYGAEALVRWLKDGQMIPPYRFIPILEREGLITELDFYVFDKVCECIKTWQDEGLTLFPVSSNFSKAHLIQEDFADRIIAIANKYDIDHKYLDIELTESFGYADKEALTRFISKIRAAGIHTSMDDFGSGYSSLELLDSSLFDIIKIDKTLTDKIEASDDGKSFIKNIIRTITESGCQVVCEGVETDSQLEYLKGQTSCFIIQGYHFDKPLPQEEYEERIKKPLYT